MNLSPGQALVRWCHQNGERASLPGQGYPVLPQPSASPPALAASSPMSTISSRAEAQRPASTRCRQGPESGRSMAEGDLARPGSPQALPSSKAFPASTQGE